MNRQVLYRKYRSRTLSEVVGQKHITDTLEASLINNRIAHAYLFVGPRGVGKTSVARIMAFEVNNMKYVDGGHIDIIEIDAASNRRIDEIRDLRDKIHIAPVEAKYKVYVIDEVHMLTREAFNALLKTLEEPPSHAIFILATTEAQKIPETIVSRTQRFVFRPIDNYSQIQHLASIAEKEELEVTEDALKMIAQYGDGSFRDSISLLDQLSAHASQIDADVVEKFLGFGNSDNIELIVDCIEKGNIRAVSDQLDSLLRQGSQPYVIAIQIIDVIRKLNPTAQHLDLIERLLAIPSSPKPHIALEVELVRSAMSYNPEKTTTAQANNDVKPAPVVNIQQERPVEVEPPKVKVTAPEVKMTQAEPVVEEAPAVSSTKLEPIQEVHWQEILSKVKQDSYPLYTVLRMAQVHANNEKMLLKFQFAIHARRFENKQLISRLREVAADIRPQTPEIIIEVDKDSQPTISDSIESMVEETANTNQNDMQVIIDAFGGGEVVEL